MKILKEGFKKIAICIVIIYLLLSLLCLDSSNITTVYATSGTVTQEQAGNIIANWAISFFESQGSLTRYNYNSGRDEAYAITKPGEYIYNFECVGWVSFAIHHSLNLSPGTFTCFGVPPGGSNNARFDNGFEQIAGDVTNPNISLDKQELSKILKPGDILVKNGRHVLLYVGNDEVIHCAGGGPVRYGKNANNQGWGLQRDNIFDYPHGFCAVGRITEETAATVDLDNISEFARSVLNYDKLADLNGVAKNGQYAGTKTLGDWLVENISEIFDYLLGIITYGIKAVFIGFINIVEKVINAVVEKITNENQNGEKIEQEQEEEVIPDDSGPPPEEYGPMPEGATEETTEETKTKPTLVDVDTVEGPKATELQDDRITVEEVIFNKIPILDVNIFKINEAGGQRISEESTTGIIRAQVRKWYVIMSSTAIIIMLFMLIYTGIRMAISTVASEKAQFKQLLLAWFIGLTVAMFIHFFMVVVLFINESLLNVIFNNSNTTIESEVSLYDTIRTKAYSVKISEGFTATIMYAFLVYILIRYIGMYTKRYLIVNILAILAPLIGIKYAFDKAKSGKSNAISGWMYEFALNVLVQTVHAILYIMLIGMAVKLSTKSLSGFAVSLVLLNFIIKADNIVMRIFNFKRAGMVGEIVEDGFGFGVFTAVFGFGKGIAKTTSNITTKAKAKFKNDFSWFMNTFQPRGMDYEKFEKWFTNKTDNMQGSFFGAIDKHITKGSVNQISARAMLGGDNEKMNKALRKQIKASHDLKMEQFKRSLDFAKSTTIGLAKVGVAIPAMIADPKVGVNTLVSGINDINKYKIKGSRSDKKYIKNKIKKNEIEMKKNAAKYKRDKAAYINSEYTYRQNRALLTQELDGLKNDATYKDAVKELAKAKRSGDINKQQAYEQLVKDFEDDIAVKENQITDLDDARKTQLDQLTELRNKIKVVKMGVEKYGRPIGVGLFGPTYLAMESVAKQAQYGVDKQGEKIEKQDKKLKMAVQAKELTNQIENKYKEIISNSSMDKSDLDKILRKTTNEILKDDIDRSVVKFASSTVAYGAKDGKIGKDEVEQTLNKMKDKINNERKETAERIVSRLGNQDKGKALSNVEKLVHNSNSTNLDTSKKEKLERIFKDYKKGNKTAEEATKLIENELVEKRVKVNSDGTLGEEKVIKYGEYKVTNELKQSVEKQVEKVEKKKNSKLSSSDFTDAIIEGMTNNKFENGIKNSKAIKGITETDTLDRVTELMKEIEKYNRLNKKAAEKNVSIPNTKIVFGEIRRKK